VRGRGACPTALLVERARGDKVAVDKLLRLVHDELRRLARRQMAGERPGHVLQAPALVNETSSSSISGGSSGAAVLRRLERRRDGRSPEGFA
jgi:hypothetical protein